jgi:hypothetical protein
MVIGADLEGATPVGATPENLRSGPAFAGRLGYKIGIPFLSLTPEAGYGYVRLSGHGGYPDFDIHRMFVGARVGFGGVLVPSVYAHLGYGFISTSGPDTVPGTTATYDNGAFVDAGFGLDLRIIPHVGVGVHVAYSVVAAEPTAVDWVNYGAQVDVTF